MSHEGGNLQNEVTREEHQHNLQAKRVVVVDESGNAINGPGPTAGVDFDYLDVQQTSATIETYVFKSGGSGGSTIRTLVITYTSSTKDNIDTISWS